MRIVANPRLLDPPVAVTTAWRQVERWLDAPSAWIPVATRRHREILTSLVEYAPRASLVPDAHVAALAIEHGLVLCSTDGDFARFPGLRWENPLAGAP